MKRSRLFRGSGGGMGLLGSARFSLGAGLDVVLLGLEAQATLKAALAALGWLGGWLAWGRKSAVQARLSGEAFGKIAPVPTFFSEVEKVRDGHGFPGEAFGKIEPVAG